MARGPAVKIILTESERSELEMRVRRRKIARADAVRAEIVLLAADGMNNCAIADELGISRLTAGLWRKRFAERFYVSTTLPEEFAALIKSEIAKWSMVIREPGIE